MADLEVIAGPADGPSIGTRYALTDQHARIGRHPHCEITLDQVAAVSRYHAEIQSAGEHFYVADTNSRNGTFVNGKRIQNRQRLYHLDRIQICDVALQFQDDRSESQLLSGDQSHQTMMYTVDDQDSSPSAIMSRIDVSSHQKPLSAGASASAKLHAMIELSESLGQALSVDDVLVPVLDGLFKIFLQADHGVIALIKDDGTWEPRCMRFRQPSQKNVRLSRSIIDHVIEKREAVLSANTDSDSRFDVSESIANLKINSFICAPLIDTEGRVLGALQIDVTSGSDPFVNEDLDLAASVASQAAIAIQRAILHDDAMKNREVQAELDLARNVQIGLLPESKPQLPEYTFYDFYRAANKIGGDYFDYVPLPDGRLVSLVADVSGHGVAAAMVMARLRSEVRFCLVTIPDIGQVVARVNQLLCEGSSEDRFVTMVLTVLDAKTHQLSVVSAGHPDPLRRKGDGSTQPLPRRGGGPLLGVLEDATYEVAVYSLEPGDTIALYTDGILEAPNPQGEPYGEPRMLKALRDAPPAVDAIGKTMIDDVMQFSGNTSQSDDICLVCIRRDTEPAPDA